MALQDQYKNMSKPEYKEVKMEAEIKISTDENRLISLHISNIDVKKTSEMWRKCLNRTIDKKVVNIVQSNLGLYREINHTRDVHIWIRKIKLEKLKKITRVLMRMLSSDIKHTEFIHIIYKFL